MLSPFKAPRVASKTVAGVLCAFNKALDDLKSVEQINEAEAARAAQDIIDAQARHDAAIAEAAMARDVSAKLSAVIAPQLPSIGVQALLQGDLLEGR